MFCNMALRATPHLQKHANAAVSLLIITSADKKAQGWESIVRESDLLTGVKAKKYKCSWNVQIMKKRN